MNTVAKAFLFGCGGLALVATLVVVSCGVWLFTGPESGVKLGNEMDQYAIDYLAEHDLLQPGEEVVAYYDATISMDGTEAAILTRDRVLYHKGGVTTSIPIADIVDVRHRYETLVGDVIEVESSSGVAMKIEIAPLNQGQTFKDVLMGLWEKTTAEPESANGALEAEGSR